MSNTMAVPLGTPAITCSRSDASLSRPTTAAPRSASFRTVASPIPWAAPVTIATRSVSSIAISLLLFLVWAEGVPCRVTDEVEAQYGEQDGEAGPHRQKWRRKEVALRVTEHVAPGCLRRLDSDAQVAERRLDQNGLSDANGRCHQHGGGRRRDQVANHDP